MKKVFISFAIEDRNLRDLLVGQARLESSPFEFVDMSVKEAWSSEWKTKCRTRIRGCDGVIAICTKNTMNASGQLWEIECAKQEGIKVKAIYGNNEKKEFLIPDVLKGIQIFNWSWNDLKNWIKGL